MSKFSAVRAHPKVVEVQKVAESIGAKIAERRREHLTLVEKLRVPTASDPVVLSADILAGRSVKPEITALRERELTVRNEIEILNGGSQKILASLEAAEDVAGSELASGYAKAILPAAEAVQAAGEALLAAAQALERDRLDYLAATGSRDPAGVGYVGFNLMSDVAGTLEILKRWTVEHDRALSALRQRAK